MIIFRHTSEVIAARGRPQGLVGLVEDSSHQPMAHSAIGGQEGLDGSVLQRQTKERTSSAER
jgi:hypothetical protein